MENKTKRIEIRVTETEFNRIKENAQKFGSVAAYIKAAFVEFSDKGGVEHFKLLNELGDFYKEFQTSLNQVGNNINQVARHLNTMGVGEDMEVEKAKAIVEASPTLTICQDLLTEIYHKLFDLTKERCKYGYPRKIKKMK